jgi:hypothetical protein
MPFRFCVLTVAVMGLLATSSTAKVQATDKPEVTSATLVAAPVNRRTITAGGTVPKRIAPMAYPKSFVEVKYLDKDGKLIGSETSEFKGLASVSTQEAGSFNTVCELNNYPAGGVAKKVQVRAQVRGKQPGPNGKPLETEWSEWFDVP